MNRHVQERASRGEPGDCLRVPRANCSVRIDDPGERDARVERRFERHQRPKRSPRASASACATDSSGSANAVAPALPKPLEHAAVPALPATIALFGPVSGDDAIQVE